MNIDQDKWLNLVEESKNSVVIDVRTPEEFVEGYIENAINIDIYNSNNFLDEIQKFDKNSDVYIYCRSGARSYQACEILKQFGYKNVFNLVGGISEWNYKIIK